MLFREMVDAYYQVQKMRVAWDLRIQAVEREADQARAIDVQRMTR